MAQQARKTRTTQTARITSGRQRVLLGPVGAGVGEAASDAALAFDSGEGARVSASAVDICEGSGVGSNVGS